MKVKLTNVRQHDSFEVEFPDTGIVMIQGVSGVGKTTIMAAIKAAFLGKEQDMAPWGSSKWEVELEFKDIWIKRTGGPATLTFKVGEVEFKDDVAQEEIYKWLSMNDTEFLTCSYVQQGQQGSILDLKPAPQQKLVEALAAGKYSVEKIRDSISDKIKERKEKWETATSVLAQAEKEAEEFKGMLVAPEQPIPKRPVEQYIEIKTKVMLAKNYKSQYQTKIEEIDKILESPFYEEVTLFESRVKERDENLFGANKKIESMLEQLSGMSKPWSSITKEDFRSQTDSLNRKIEWISARKKLVEIANEIYTLEPSAKVSGVPLIEFLTGRVHELREEQRNKSSEALLKRKEAEKLSKAPPVHNCPQCDGELVIINDKIYLAQDVPKDALNKLSSLKESIQHLNDEISGFDSYINKINSIKETASTWKEKVGTDPAPNYKTVEAVKARIAELRLYADWQETIFRERTKLEASIASSKKFIADESSSLTVLEEKIKSYGDMPNRVLLKAEKEGLKNKLASVQAQIDGFSDIVSEKAKYDADLAAYESKRESYNKMLDRVESKNAAVATARSNLKTADSEYAAITRLKEKSDFAAVEANELMVYQINENASKFIDRLFADDGTVVKINNVTTVGKGSKTEDRAKFSTEVYHKGLKAKRKGFSGGEKSRSCLAFQLGLSEMYNSPILMVDEGFAGLDEELKTLCLEVLKEVSQDRLILVIEHGAPESFFDEVVHV